MLHIHFRTTEKTIEDIDRYFPLNFKSEWLENEFVREMIKDISTVDFINEKMIDTLIEEEICTDELPRQIKVLLCLLFKPENEYYGTYCGDECGRWILEIAKKHDITLAFDHILRFKCPEEANVTSLNIHILNNGKMVDTMAEFVTEAVNCL